MYKRNGNWRLMICKNRKRKDVSLGTDFNKAKIIKASIEQTNQDDRFKKNLVDTLIELGYIDKNMTAAADDKCITWEYAKLKLIEYLRNIKRAEATIVSYNYMFSRIESVLKPTKPSDITNEKVDHWIETLLNTKNPRDRTGQTNLSRGAVNVYIRTAKAAFQRFVRWQYLDNNPFKCCEAPKVDYAPPRPLSEEEIDKLLAASNKPLKRCIKILVYSGMRPNELYNLHWRRVVFERNAYIQIAEDKNWHPKAYTQRRIPITKELEAALGKAGDPDTLVAGLNERRFPVNKNWLTRSFSRSVQRAGLVGKKISLYCCRDTYATNLAVQGYEAHVIAARLGHRDVSTSMHYVSLAKLSTAHIGNGNGRNK